MYVKYAFWGEILGQGPCKPPMLAAENSCIAELGLMLPWCTHAATKANQEPYYVDNSCSHGVDGVDQPAIL